MVLSQRLRLIVILSIILVIAFIFLSLFNYHTAKTSIRGEIVSSSLPLLRENIYSELQKDFVPSIHRASMMANDSFLKHWVLNGEEEIEKLLQYLNEIQEKYGYFSTFFISDVTKNYYHFDGILKQISRQDDHDVWYYRFIESGKEYDLDVDTNEAAMNRLTIFINFRVEDYQGRLLGVTGVGIEMANFSEFISEKQEKYDRRIFLVDHNGLIQAHSDKTMIMNTSIHDLPGIQNIASTILREENGPLDKEYEHNHTRVLVTARYMPELDWFLIVEQDESTALTAVRRNLWRTILVGIGTSAIIITLTAFTVTYFQNRLEYLAVTDELTKVANRREFDTQLEKAIYRYSRYGIPFSLIIIDVDHFKRINDTLGHITGDKILVNVSDLIKSNIRPDDHIARWGGDEFMVLVESKAEEAERMAERLAQTLREKAPTFNHLEGQTLSLSMGIAEYLDDDTSDSLIKRADQALYASKADGRDRITVYDGEDTV